MNTPHYSDHALARMQERGLTKELVEFLLSHGHCVHSGGAKVFYCPLHSLRKIAKEDLISSLAINKLARFPYVVVANDSDKIITAGYREGRIKRDTKPYRRARQNSKRGRSLKGGYHE